MCYIRTIYVHAVSEPFPYTEHNGMQQGNASF